MRRAAAATLALALALAVLESGMVVAGERDPDAAFRRWAKKRMREHGARLSRWGWAQVERFAVACVDGGEWILLEERPGVRWSFARATTWRNACVPRDDAKWERALSSALTLRDVNRGGEDTTMVAFVHERPAIVAESETVRMAMSTCFTDERDFVRNERRFTRCRWNDDGRPIDDLPVRSALVVAGAWSGDYRRRLAGSGDPVDFDVRVLPLGSSMQVTVRVPRPSTPGESFEVWTANRDGKPFLAARLPNERARHERLQYVVNLPFGEGARELPLTVVAVSADGTTRVATSDFDPGDGNTLGRAMVPPRLEATRE